MKPLNPRGTSRRVNQARYSSVKNDSENHPSHVFDIRNTKSNTANIDDEKVKRPKGWIYFFWSLNPKNGKRFKALPIKDKAKFYLVLFSVCIVLLAGFGFSMEISTRIKDRNQEKAFLSQFEEIQRSEQEIVSTTATPADNPTKSNSVFIPSNVRTDYSFGISLDEWLDRYNANVRAHLIYDNDLTAEENQLVVDMLSLNQSMLGQIEDNSDNGATRFEYMQENNLYYIQLSVDMYGNIWYFSMSFNYTNLDYTNLPFTVYQWMANALYPEKTLSEHRDNLVKSMQAAIDTRDNSSGISDNGLYYGFLGSLETETYYFYLMVDSSSF